MLPHGHPKRLRGLGAQILQGMRCQIQLLLEKYHGGPMGYERTVWYMYLYLDWWTFRVNL